MRKNLIKNKKDIITFIFLSLLVYLAWSKLPLLTIRSDGFLYMFDKSHQQFFNTPLFFTGFENSAMIFGLILPKLFGVNLALYYWAALITIITITFFWYLGIKEMTKNRLVGFFAALMFGVNYFGIWDMISTHCYCFYLERIIPTLFLIPSFIFLQKFFNYKKRHFLIISLIFYFLGVGFGHFVVLFTPFYLFYPIFWYLFEKKKIKDKIKGLYLGLSFLGISAFFIAIQQINESGLGPKKWTFIEFLSNPQKFMYIKKVSLQLVYLSQYPYVIKDIMSTALMNIIEPSKASDLIPYFVLGYLVAGFVIYKKLPKQRPILFTISFATIFIFYLNAYFNQYDMVYWSGASRYLFFPSFLISLFWALFIWAVFFIKGSKLKIIGIILLALYYFINFRLVEGNFAQVITWNRSTRAVFDYIITKRPTLLKNTLVLATYPEFGSQESTFFTQEIGKGEVRYMSLHNPDDVDTWERQASVSAHVIKLRYNQKCDCIIEENIK